MKPSPIRHGESAEKSTVYKALTKPFTIGEIPQRIWLTTTNGAYRDAGLEADNHHLNTKNYNQHPTGCFLFDRQSLLTAKYLSL